MVLNIKNESGTYNISEITSSVSLSGDVKECTRTLSFEFLVSGTDKSIPNIHIPLGGLVTFSENGKMLFVGYVFEKTKSTEANTMTVTCFDRGIYLKKNEASYKFVNQTAESITKHICHDFGLKVGTIATTGIKISRKFDCKNLYQIIQSGYTLDSEQSGKQYIIRFDGLGKLNVIQRVTSNGQRILAYGQNIMTATYSESIKDMVNRVRIVSSEGSFIKNVSNDNYIKLYGLFQTIIKKSKNSDAFKKAESLLKDNGVNQKITVNSLGDTSCITGNTVVIKEPFTGLDGVFWIDSDVHQWKNGIYTNKLELNFRNMMDEQTAGDSI